MLMDIDCVGLLGLTMRDRIGCERVVTGSVTVGRFNVPVLPMLYSCSREAESGEGLEIDDVLG